MNLNVHIERLVLDGVDLGGGQPHLLQAAIQTELLRLLSQGGLAPALSGGAALARVVGPAMNVRTGGGTADVGRQIAGAVYGGIGR